MISILCVDDDGVLLFSYQSPVVPSTGEKIERRGVEYLVKSVCHSIQDRSYSSSVFTSVSLVLEKIIA